MCKEALMKYVLVTVALVVAVAAPAMAEPFSNPYALCTQTPGQCR